MKPWSLLTEFRMLAHVRLSAWKNRHQPIGLRDVLHALDDDRERRPQDRFHQECSAIAELDLRDTLGIQRYDA